MYIPASFLSIGIDPGLTGAVAFIYYDHTLKIRSVHVHDIPVMAKGKGAGRVKNEVDAAGLTAILNSYVDDNEGGISVTARIERVSSMPGQGVAGVFSLGDTYGTIRGVLAALHIPLLRITPQEWKRHYKLGRDKEVVRATAIDRFPECDLHLKKHHNRAEALLIANYGISKEVN